MDGRGRVDPGQRQRGEVRRMHRRQCHGSQPRGHYLVGPGLRAFGRLGRYDHPAQPGDQTQRGDLMAIAVVQTLTASTVSGTSITFSSWTPAANELLLVAVALRDETIAPSVAGNGLTWVSVCHVENVTNQGGINLFRALGASPSAGGRHITPTGKQNPPPQGAFLLSGGE